MPRKIPKKYQILAVTAVSVLAVAGYFYYGTNRSQPTDQTEPEISSEKSTEKTPVSKSPEEPKPPPSPEPEKQNPTSTPAASFGLTLTRDVEQRGTSVQVRALVSGATHGTCKVTFTRSGRSVSKSSSITYDGRTYSCGALNVATASFSSSGTWSFKLIATSGAKVSNEISGQVTVKK